MTIAACVSEIRAPTYLSTPHVKRTVPTTWKASLVAAGENSAK